MTDAIRVIADELHRLHAADQQVAGIEAPGTSVCASARSTSRAVSTSVPTCGCSDERQPLAGDEVCQLAQVRAGAPPSVVVERRGRRPARRPAPARRRRRRRPRPRAARPRGARRASRQLARARRRARTRRRAAGRSGRARRGRRRRRAAASPAARARWPSGPARPSRPAPARAGAAGPSQGPRRRPTRSGAPAIRRARSAIRPTHCSSHSSSEAPVWSAPTPPRDPTR